MDPELARRNLRFGWALFFLFWLLFAGTFLVAALVLGGIFLGLALQLRRAATPRHAGVLFHYSLLYLALLFAAAALDPVLF